MESRRQQLTTRQVRSKAVGNGKVPMANRVYVVVVSQRSGALPMFFDARHSVGRCLDGAAEASKVINNNNKPTAPRLRLFDLHGQPLAMDKPLAQLGASSTPHVVVLDYGDELEQEMLDRAALVHVK